MERKPVFADIAARLAERNKRSEQEQVKVQIEAEESIALTKHPRIMKFSSNYTSVHAKSTFYRIAVAEGLIMDTELHAESSSLKEEEQM